MSLNTPQAWPPPPTLPPPAQEQNVRWKLPVTLPADRNWLVSFTDTEIAFRRPGKQRILGTFLIVMALLCVLESWRKALHNIMHDPVVEIGHWAMFLGTALVGLMLALPNSLTLDLRQRTYRFRYVPLLVPKVVTGPLTDIATLAIASGALYTIIIRWSEAVAKSRPCATLGQYSDKPADAAAARTLMRRVAAKLDVPCAYPYLFHIKYPETQAK